MVVLNSEIRHRAETAIKALNLLGKVQAAFVFGSYADGCADRWSDIDVAAFMENVESWDIQQRANAMVHVQKHAGFDVEAHLFPVSSLYHSEPGSFVSHILQHGICILKEEKQH